MSTVTIHFDVFIYLSRRRNEFLSHAGKVVDTKNKNNFRKSNCYRLLLQMRYNYFEMILY